MYPRNAISSVTPAIATIESSAPISVGKGTTENEMGIDGVRTGITLGESNRSAISAMIPNPIAGIAARQIRAEGAEEREYFRRAPRVAAGGPQPEKYAAYNPRTTSVIGNAQGISGCNFRFPSSGRKVIVEPISRSTIPSTIARTKIGRA